MKTLILSLFIFLSAPFAQAEDQYSSHYFGRVPVGTSMVAGYFLENTGNEALVIYQEAVSGVYFSSASNCPEVLDPQQKCYTQIRYWPMTSGFHNGLYSWQTSAGNIYLNLNGEAY